MHCTSKPVCHHQAEKKTQHGINSFVPQKVKNPLCLFLEVVRTTLRTHEAPTLEERLCLPAHAPGPDAAAPGGAWMPNNKVLSPLALPLSSLDSTAGNNVMVPAAANVHESLKNIDIQSS